jgi:hypothetical protein
MTPRIFSPSRRMPPGYAEAARRVRNPGRPPCTELATRMPPVARARHRGRRPAGRARVARTRAWRIRAEPSSSSWYRSRRSVLPFLTVERPPRACQDIFLPANPGSPGMPDALSRARAYMTVRGRPRFRHAILRPPAGAVLRPARAGQGTVPAGGRAHRPAVRIGDHERARRAFAERRRGHAGSGTPHSGAETQAARTLPGDAGEPRGRGAARTRTVQIIGTSRSGRTEPP